MPIEIGSEVAALFLKTRQDLHLTQLELSEKSRISLRAIKDLESGRRKSFNEDTLIRLCRALGLDYKALNGSNGATPTKVRKIAARPLALFLGGSFILAALSLGFFSFRIMNKPPERIDWVFHDPMLVRHFTPPWNGDNIIHVNYYHLNQTVIAGDTVSAELKWSYHFVEGSTPIYYVSAFAKWDPDHEIRVFDGMLRGEGSRIDSFKVVAARGPTVSIIRVFYSSAYAPMSSYYGHPLDDQLSSPSSAPYIRIPIEVLPK